MEEDISSMSPGETHKDAGFDLGMSSSRRDMRPFRFESRADFVYRSNIRSSRIIAFISTLPAILVNRFMINLRSAAAIPSLSSRSQASAVLGFRIPTISLGNIGESLENREYGEVEAEAEVDGL
ncbi:hypothetical protein PHLGIDRAFT_368876 [Phlebiopsis gigantea 11061_1 CR5-6]|uniref:Uncharacterized protein n=1 Tax=Phlebiopsis gigantea (strain 11061_1 CR5-6) TaxID=745531 RepID=A0A0C3P2I1_PHLG1|nr:hypothetical protein PHLGIDRAFT_368876 [Phlebiopsis gigantea 11061_1 CR5-6]